jgi:hypothetical protein
VRTVLLHGHIFKNAGSSLDWSLRRSFGDGFVDHRDDRSMIDGGAGYLGQLIAGEASLVALSSHHLCYPLPELPDVHLEPVFLFRHPLSRMASAYAFERRQQADTPGARSAKRLNFRDYIAWRLQPEVSPALRNYQATYLLGLHDHSEPLALDHDTFLAAESRLAQLPAVGVVERYAESMVVLEQRLLPLLPAIDLASPRQNVTTDWVEDGLDSTVDAVLDKLGDLRSSALQANQYDVALYEQANRQLDQALAAIPDASLRLREFQARCDRLD